MQVFSSVSEKISVLTINVPRRLYVFGFLHEFYASGAAFSRDPGPSASVFPRRESGRGGCGALYTLNLMRARMSSARGRGQRGRVLTLLTLYVYVGAFLFG